MLARQSQWYGVTQIIPQSKHMPADRCTQCGNYFPRHSEDTKLQFLLKIFIFKGIKDVSRIILHIKQSNSISLNPLVVIQFTKCVPLPQNNTLQIHSFCSNSGVKYDNQKNPNRKKSKDQTSISTEQNDKGFRI